MKWVPFALENMIEIIFMVNMNKIITVKYRPSYYFTYLEYDDVGKKDNKGLEVGVVPLQTLKGNEQDHRAVLKIGQPDPTRCKQNVHRP